MRPLRRSPLPALLLAALAGCVLPANEAMLPHGTVPVLGVVGEVVETRPAEPATSYACSYAQPYQGGLSEGHVRFEPFALREVANATALVFLEVRLRTPDSSVCSPGRGVLLYRGEQLPLEGHGLAPFGNLTLDGHVMEVDGRILREGSEIARFVEGVRRSGYEGDHHYRGTLLLRHEGCWRFQDERTLVRGTCP